MNWFVIVLVAFVLLMIEPLAGLLWLGGAVLLEWSLP